MERVILDVDFSRIEGNRVISRTGNQGEIHGDPAVVRGYDGRPSLYFDNQGAGRPVSMWISVPWIWGRTVFR